MPVQRFLGDRERIIRGFGYVIALVGFALLAWAAFEIQRAGRIGIAGMVYVLIFLAILGAGLRFVFVHKEYLEIDVEARKYSVYRAGKKIAGGALDSLGPLRVSRRSYQTGGGGSATNPQRSYTITNYVVSAAQHSKIDLYAVKTPARARRKMEALARAWGVSCQSYGGEVRAVGQLDVPLHERLRGDRSACTPAPLDPAWGLRIEPLSPGYALVSTHRSWEPLRVAAFLVLALLIGAGFTGMRATLSMPWSDEAGPVERVLGGAMTALVVAALVNLALGARDTFAPGSVRITPEGVAYRGRRLRFAEIEEVVSTPRVELLGDRKSLKLAPSFCPPRAVTSLMHELQRLIVETGLVAREG
jgi:hypothetical protein